MNVFYPASSVFSFFSLIAKYNFSIEVRDSIACSSAVGKIGGVQPLNLAAACMKVTELRYFIYAEFNFEPSK